MNLVKAVLFLLLTVIVFVISFDLSLYDSLSRVINVSIDDQEYSFPFGTTASDAGIDGDEHRYDYLIKDNDSFITEKKDDSSYKEDKKISINEASIEELCTLPGIGPATAEKIIEYRESTGGFRCTEEVMNISGIKEKKYEKIRDHISV